MEAKKVHSLAPGHTARTWQRTDLNPSILISATLLLTSIHTALLKEGRSKAIFFHRPDALVRLD